VTRRLLPMVFAALFAFTLAAMPVIAIENQVPHEAIALVDQSYKELLLLYGNLGLAGVFLLFLLWSLKRQDSIETINKRYAESADAHLSAFKEISANTAEAFKQINDRNTSAFREVMEVYRHLSDDSRKVALMTVGANERIVTMLEGMERRKQ
jgi:hypothetical protein